ncbi:uncharacterized protein CTHT_0038670 [Thermochaetoides thermophila DSM 1495]|uniref:Cyclin-like domain-containing protein n=1 Tax=Chaetomium thermophilum (strain DSM 1495 / CBS 144.50 / IMI 039719) TaxID=759272 RepID=G0S8N0_CHATD|nr:hypothetical protein CTHT_0038670 [Thermochaetoides thermophila DSM 1495]EGS21990.1 hypothetical protein CTHT_0038670 [Thermochaetoides thermophila DSM 1495]
MSLLANPLVTSEQLFQRRSVGALPIEIQDAIFFATQSLTQAAGILLELPQSVTAQANVLLARYWLVENMMADEFSVRTLLPLLPPSPEANRSQDVSAAILYLTAKLSSHPRSPRELSAIYSYLLSKSSPFFRTQQLQNLPKYVPPPESHYQSFRPRLLTLESRILAALSFNTHVALPHPLAITYLQSLDFFCHPRREALARRTIAYLNTALLSPQLLYTTHQPHALAVAAIYCAARDLGAKMPECEWWEVFDVEREELGFLVVGMRSVEGWARERLMVEVPTSEGGMITRGDVERVLREREEKRG